MKLEYSANWHNISFFALYPFDTMPAIVTCAPAGQECFTVDNHLMSEEDDEEDAFHLFEELEYIFGQGYKAYKVKDKPAILFCIGDKQEFTNALGIELEDLENL